MVAAVHRKRPLIALRLTFVGDGVFLGVGTNGPPSLLGYDPRARYDLADALATEIVLIAYLLESKTSARKLNNASIAGFFSSKRVTCHASF